MSAGFTGAAGVPAPGELTRRLLLEAPVAVPDGRGGQIVTWQALGTHWAALRPGAGRERLEDPVRLGVVPWRAILRGAPVGSPARPRPEQRLREGTRVFTILAVAELDPAGRWLECRCEEEAGA